jgi:hypothetical protein
MWAAQSGEQSNTGTLHRTSSCSHVPMATVIASDVSLAGDKTYVRVYQLQVGDEVRARWLLHRPAGGHVDTELLPAAAQLRLDAGPQRVVQTHYLSAVGSTPHCAELYCTESPRMRALTGWEAPPLRMPPDCSALDCVCCRPVRARAEQPSMLRQHESRLPQVPARRGGGAGILGAGCQRRAAAAAAAGRARPLCPPLHLRALRAHTGARSIRCTSCACQPCHGHDS